MPGPRNRSAQQPSVVTHTPVYEHGRWIYENSLWLQRTVIDASGRRGLVLEINLSLNKPGTPTVGEQFTVIYYGADDMLDPSSIRRISGKVLASIKQDSWETFPPESPFVNDPDVEFVAAPGAEAGWRWTQEEYEAKVTLAKTARRLLELQADYMRARMKGTSVAKVKNQLKAAGVPESQIPLAIAKEEQQQQQMEWLKQQPARKQQQLQAWREKQLEQGDKQQEQDQTSSQQQAGSSKVAVTKEGCSNRVDTKPEYEDTVNGRCYGQPVELYWQQKAAKERACKQQAEAGAGSAASPRKRATEQQQAGQKAAASPKKQAKKAAVGVVAEQQKQQPGKGAAASPKKGAKKALKSRN